MGTLMVEHPAVTLPGRGLTLVFDLSNSNAKDGDKNPQYVRSVQVSPRCDLVGHVAMLVPVWHTSVVQRRA